MNVEKSGDEVSMLELYVVAMRYKWWILASSLVSAILAALFVTFVLHPVWEASAVLEVGQVMRTKGKEPVEQSINVVARMLQPSFAMAVLRDAGFKPNDLSMNPDRFVGGLKVAKMKDAELLEVSVRAPSQKMALNQLNASIAYLQKVHLQMMADAMSGQRKALEQVTRDIQNNQVEVELLKKKLFAAREWNAFDATMVGIVLKDKTGLLGELIEKKLHLEEQMGSQNTYTTRTVGDVDVSDGPVAPKKPLIIGVAILLGLLAGMAVAFMHNAITSQASRK